MLIAESLAIIVKMTFIDNVFFARQSLDVGKSNDYCSVYFYFLFGYGDCVIVGNHRSLSNKTENVVVFFKCVINNWTV